MTRTARVAARLLVIDPDGHVLLFRGFDPKRPEAGSWWFTPGGGLDEGETVEGAARRELHEETGLVVTDLGPCIFEQQIQFDFEDSRFDQTEYFFCVRADRFEIARSGWNDVEQRSILEHRWWSVAELSETREKFHPEALVEHMARILGS